MSDPRSINNSHSSSSEESREDLLLQQILEYNDKLQLLEGRLIKTKHELDIANQILSCYPYGIVYVNEDLQIVYANAIFCTMVGHDLIHLVKKDLFQDIISPEPGNTPEALLQKATEDGNWQGKVTLKKDNNRRIPLSLSLNYKSIVTPREKKAGFICLFSQSETNLASQQEQQPSLPVVDDPLAKLPNRIACQKHIADRIKTAGGEQGHIGILCIDIDHFKRINRIQGTYVGDKVLLYVTSILKKYGDGTGNGYIARLGGDVFALVFQTQEDETEAGQLAEKIQHTIQQPLTIQSRDVFITASIGISLYPADGKDAQELLHNANIAMKKAKSDGGNSTHRWDKKTISPKDHNLELENDFYQAVAKRELINYYQPQISMTNGVIVGMEALARWEHPKHGFVSPGVFIPIAENLGIISKMSYDLISLACEQGRNWLSMGFNFTMAVNISGSMLRHADLFDRIMECLKRTKFPPSKLELELTESILVDNIKNTVAFLDKCRQIGIKLAIDDFGTGYSSLSYLQRFAVDKLKIDRSFVQGLPDNESDATIALAIIAMAQKLGFQILAEGIETEDQLRFLQEHNCNECQGFLFSKPISAQRMTHLLIHDTNVAMKHRRVIDKFFSIKENKLPKR